MTTIAAENLKQIRQPFEVHAGLTARQDIALSYSVAGEKTVDADVTSLSNPTWDMRHFTDFQGEGFVLDGSCELYDPTKAASLEDGKIGIRGNIGGTFTVNVSAASKINALTVAVTSGTGTVNGMTARRIVVVPVDATSITLTFVSDDPEERLEVASIVAGINLEFDNSNLISTTLDLRSDLSIINPSWEISSIEIQAYWADDISTAVANIADDVPIYYYSGYPGDYSEIRQFYMSEAATMTNNLLTIRGEDMSHKLEDADNVKLQRLDSQAKTGWKALYNFFVSVIKGAGIKAQTETAPGASGSMTTASSMVIQEASPRDYVADIMNQAHTGTFWATFVDAGIPKITWTKPTAKWDIYEEDCGNVTEELSRNVAKIKVATDSEFGVENTVTRANTWTVLQKDIKITKNVPITKKFDAWFWTYQVAYAKNKKFDFTTLNSVKWTPAYTTTKKKTKKKVNGKTKTVTTWLYRPTLYGKRISPTVSKRSITESTNRAGYTAEVSPLAIGMIKQSNTVLYPNYKNLFNRSNKGGSFTWKGNPKMQPRDVVNFHRLDGTVETITIASIQLTHEGGGTVANISYKNGIV